MADALSLHSRKSNVSQEQNILRLCTSFTGCVWSWRFKQKASLSPIILEVRFSRHWCQCSFESALAHEHCTEAHTHTTQLTALQTLGYLVHVYSIVILRCYADDFKTAQQIACRVSECETSVTTLSNYYFWSVASVYSYHTSATVTTKVELWENRTVTTRHVER